MATEIIMPAMEMAQETGTIVRWLKAEGDSVQKGEPLMEIETDKVTIEIESPASGVLSNVTARAGDEIPVGQVIGLIRAADETPPEALQSTAHPVARPIARRIAADHDLVLSAVQQSSQRRLLASPRARRLAAEHHLELAGMTGSGPDGAVLTADVERIVARQPQVVQPAARFPGPYRVVPIKGVRRVIAERLQASYQSAPHISLTVSVDMTEILHMIERLNPGVEAAAGRSLTMTSVLIRFVGLALVKHPRLNAHLVADELREFTAVHLGIAVALDDGLIVPVVQHVEQKGLAAIQVELHDLSERARVGRLKPHEVKGSTFTLSNLGMFGIEHFTAILNPPEVGILAVGAIQDCAVGMNGEIVLRPIMRLTLNVDHRAVDGAVAAAFLKTLKETLENPYLVGVLA